LKRSAQLEWPAELSLYSGRTVSAISWGGTPPHEIAETFSFPLPISLISLISLISGEVLSSREQVACPLAALAPAGILWQPEAMSDRKEPVRKTPAEILADLMAGHREALCSGPEKAGKYLLNFIGRANSIPNAVKFFLYDLLAEDTFQCGDSQACRSAVSSAVDYLPVARDELSYGFREYLPSIRLFERGIALAIDEGEFEQALELCDQAIKVGLGKAYEAKRASIERMM
jgi:hypothetical protein